MLHCNYNKGYLDSGFRDSDRSVIRVIEMVSEKRARGTDAVAREDGRERGEGRGGAGKKAGLAGHGLTVRPLDECVYIRGV